MFNSSFYAFVFISGFVLTLSSCQSPAPNDSTVLPAISFEERNQIIAQLEQQQKSLFLCNQEQDKALSQNAVTIYSLSQTEYLVEVLCFLGAYQGNYQYLFLNKEENRWRKIKFSTFNIRSSNFKLTNTDTLVGSIDFDEVTQILTVQNQARGLGDCGSYARYQWVDNSQFELQEYRNKSECDGVYLQPEKYPLIYP